MRFLIRIILVLLSLACATIGIVWLAVHVGTGLRPGLHWTERVLHTLAASAAVIAAYGLARVANTVCARTYTEKKARERDGSVLVGLILGAAIGFVIAGALVISIDLNVTVAGMIAFGSLLIGWLVGMRFARPMPEEDLRCPQCGYDLRGTPWQDDGSLRCSECGSEWYVRFLDKDENGRK